MPLILIPPYRMTVLANAVLTTYGVDPYIDYTTFLMHFEGANGQQVFKESMGHPITRTGQVITSTYGYKVGTSSAYFNNTAGSVISTKGADLILGTGDFTIEFWCVFGQNGANGTGRGVFQLSTGVNNGFEGSKMNNIAIGSSHSNAGKLEVYWANTNTVTNFTPSSVAWVHVAIVRSNGVSKLFLNGVESASISDTTNYTGNTLSLGAYYSTAHPLDGNIDEFRITKGVARYTGPFTPSTTAHPDKKSEQLFSMNTLTDQASNSLFLDSGTTPTTITTTAGKPAQGTYSPYSQNGWSARFNGTTDYLRIQPTAPAMNNYSTLGQNWAAEAWYTFDDVTKAGDQTLWTIGAEPWGGATPYIRLVWNANGIGTGNGRLWAEEANTSIGLWSVGGQFNPVPGKPYHIVLNRLSNVLRMYINGNLFAQFDWSGTHQSHPTLTIGAMYYRGGNQDYFSGSISNFRILMDENYAGEFTPSNKVLGVTGGTKVLIANRAAHADSGPMNYPVKVGGGTMMMNRSYISPITYAPETHGGSIYFDGSSDRLALAPSSAFNLSSGTFTIAFWMNPLTKPVAGNTCRFFYTGINGQYEAFFLGFTENLALWASVPQNGVTGFVSPNNAITLGVWQHVAFVCNNGTMRLFVNGQLVSGPTTITKPTSSNSLGAVMGYDVHGTIDHKFKGWISDFRITDVGTTTANFTNPTAPSAVNVNTKLKLNFTNAQMTSPKVPSTIAHRGAGAVITKSDKSPAGSYAAYYSGNCYSEIFNNSQSSPTAAAIGPGDFGTEDFTVGFWMNSTQNSAGYKSAVGTQAVAGNAVAGMWRVSTSLNNVAGLYFNYSTGGGFIDLTFSTTNLHDGKWHHVAVVRSGGVLTAYVDGVKVGNSQTVTQSLSSRQPLVIAYQAQDNAYWEGYIDGVDVTRFGAMYSGPFTPPNALSHPN